MNRIARLLAAAALAALAPATAAFSAQPLKVVASFSVIADFARQVGGDRVAVTTIVPPGGDAHVYEPAPQDAAATASADLVLVNGLHFEGFLTRLLQTAATRAPVVELARDVRPIPVKAEFADDEEGLPEGSIDPHAFQSVPNAKLYVGTIVQAYCGADPAGCEVYKANAARYSALLDDTDRKVRAAVAAIPADRRVIITSHDAFGYFEHEYGLTFHAPQGISTEAEPSAAHLAALVGQAKEEKAAAIFLENITNPQLAQTISQETGLRIGGTLYSDSLSDKDGAAATYVDMMLHNVETIRGAVAGS